MARCIFLLFCTFSLLASEAHAYTVEHTFRVANLTITRLCQTRTVVAVNGQIPGPTIKVQDGDLAIVHVINDSPYNISIHWHGIFQKLSGWADGPSYVTQCPITPGNRYTYRFNIIGQEGTLWWHAHFSTLRETVYGALLIRPRHGPKQYPFLKPYKEVPIILGEWWNGNVVDLENQALAAGVPPIASNAFTINGQPGDLYNCSNKYTYKLIVEHGKTYMLRIINAALDTQLFFKIAGHSLTVVAVDASYTEPFHTDVVVLGPGQTVDALMVADAPPSRYYMASRGYDSAPIAGIDNTTTTGIVQYKYGSTTSTPIMPVLPEFTDTPTVYKFYSNLTGLLLPRFPTVPLTVDEKMFITFGLGLVACDLDVPCQGPFGEIFAASMNNVSFKFPELSLLQAHFFGVPGIYTPDFPDQPPLEFDYTNPALSFNQTLLETVKGTKVKRLKYNTTVEVVLQDTALLSTENHPIHLHGFNFFVVAQGFGNYNATTATESFNLVNPQVRNTIGVPVGGWAVIRFVADNPGVWFFHCHLDAHLAVGLALAFEVENGPTPSSILPPPPADLPRC